ncbi:MAG TPA: radical SAM protein [Candidatus Ozemobacteraceae bacterium]|nr:radical SAM protein [Candidatus Ozemobacteraceae bacterium]
MAARVFGPVPSRRLGRSLGLDLTPAKTCTYDCRYCQLSATDHPATGRSMFFPPEELLAELRATLSRIETPDWITCSGTGEPTLYAGLGTVLRGIRELSQVPICVITNGSLLGRPDVRADLCFADRVLPTLCSVREDTWRAIHRPAAGIKFPELLNGLKAFGAMYPGMLELEVFICPGLNDTPEEVAALGAWLRELPGLDAVYLNAAVRSPIDASLPQADAAHLDGIRHALGLQVPVTTAFDHTPLPRAVNSKRPPTARELLELLKRHPCTIEQLHRVFGGEREFLQRLAADLLETKTVELRPDGTLAPL